MAVRNRVRFRSSETNMIVLMPAVLKSSSHVGVLWGVLLCVLCACCRTAGRRRAPLASASPGFHSGCARQTIARQLVNELRVNELRVQARSVSAALTLATARRTFFQEATYE